MLQNGTSKRSKIDKSIDTTKNKQKRQKKDPNVKLNLNCCEQKAALFTCRQNKKKVKVQSLSTKKMQDIIQNILDILKKHTTKQFVASIGCSWAALGVLLGRSQAALGRSRAILGRSWAALGALFGSSWAALGLSRPLLGRSWNDMLNSSKE